MHDVAVEPMTQAQAAAAVVTIRSGLETLGAAILDLYEREGWRALGYVSWRSCVEAEFGWGKSYAYDRLRAARIVAELSAIAETTPRNEAQARELARIDDPQERVEVWRAAVDRHGSAVTAADVRGIAEARSTGDSVRSVRLEELEAVIERGLAEIRKIEAVFPEMRARGLDGAQNFADFDAWWQDRLAATIN
jgi:hypothetical protein